MTFNTINTINTIPSKTFAPLKNDSYLRALRQESTEYIPIWLMRQAGRYLPEYLATRTRAGSFMNLAMNPDLACEVTLQPLDRYPQLDAAILFSDILTVPDAMGLELSFATGEGPKFAKPLRHESDVLALQVPDLNKLKYVFDAVHTIRYALNGRVPLIGFSGSPWTLACYMVEGGGSADFRTIKTMLYSRPDLIKHIMTVNETAVAQYLLEQVKSGAQALMLFDTWGGILPDGIYQKISLASMSRVIASVKQHFPDMPITVFTKGGGVWLNDIVNCGADCIGLDWTVNLGQARRLANNKVALQGNIDPFLLMGSNKEIEYYVHNSLSTYHTINGNSIGHIFNLGHGINQFTPPAAVNTLLEAVKQFKIASI
jgi:uroporphyrinogen decarboxylase